MLCYITQFLSFSKFSTNEGNYFFQFLSSDIVADDWEKQS